MIWWVCMIKGIIMEGSSRCFWWNGGPFCFALRHWHSKVNGLPRPLLYAFAFSFFFLSPLSDWLRHHLRAHCYHARRPSLHSVFIPKTFPPFPYHAPSNRFGHTKANKLQFRLQNFSNMNIFCKRVILFNKSLLI